MCEPSCGAARACGSWCAVAVASPPGAVPRVAQSDRYGGPPGHRSLRPRARPAADPPHREAHAAGAIKPKLKDFDEADSAGITPLRHVPIWKGSERTLYDLAAYIKEAVEAMKDGRPPPDPTDYAMEELAPLSL